MVSLFCLNEMSKDGFLDFYKANIISIEEHEPTFVH